MRIPKPADVRLKAKLIVTIAFLLVLTAASIAALSFYTARSELTDSAEHALTSLAVQGAKLVKSRVELHLMNIESVASKARIRTMNWDSQKKVLEEDLKRLNYLAMAVVTPDFIGHYHDGTTTDLSGRDYIKKAFEGKVNMSSVLTSRATNSSVIMTAAPIKDDAGKIAAVVIARLPATILNEITDQIRFGKRGYAYIIDGTGTLIAHDNKEFVLDQKNFIHEAKANPDLVPLASMMTRMVERKSGSEHYMFLGANRFFGYAPIDGTDWSIAAGSFTDDLMTGVRTLLLYVAIVSAAVLLIGTAIGFLLARNVTNPIAASINALKRVSEGDLSVSMPPDMLSRGDEAGDLSRGIQAMGDSLRTLIGQITQGVETLASSSSEMSEIATTMSSEAEASSNKSALVATASEELSAGAATVASGIGQSASNLSAVASATEQMSSTVGEIAANSERARAIAATAIEQTAAVGGIMEKLGVSAQEIGKVTETINKISNQTNLLALNATIEAARAGAAGKGFAVVASEIKALSIQTRDATVEIKNLIGGIQSSTGTAIADVEKIAGVVRESGDVVASIATAIEEQAAVTKDMARNITEANAGVRDASQQVSQTAEVTKEIAQDIAAVSASSTQMSAASQQVQASAMDLSHLSEQLNELVCRFQLECRSTLDSEPRQATRPRHKEVGTATT